MTLDINFPFALGGPLGVADFRSQPADFQVEELLTVEPVDNGEHVYLDITKTGANTFWVAKEIANFAGVRPQDVGYCGQKDRHAITRQWFSIYLPKAAERNWLELNSESVTVNVVQQGHKKLRRGAHEGNRFEIRLRHFEVDPEVLDQRMAAVTQGVPNYFGEQRFGRGGGNLDLVEQWVSSGRLPRHREKKSTVISSARSYLFNRYLAQRVHSRTWNTLVEGDSLQNGQPTGPLWGRGRSPATGAAAEMEAGLAADWPQWIDRLEHCGLDQQRRALVLQPQQFRWHYEPATGDLDVGFALAPGEFATAVLREIARLQDLSLRDDLGVKSQPTG